MPLEEIAADFYFIERGWLNANHFVFNGHEPVYEDIITRDGCTPRHSHPRPHINYAVSGQGTIFLDGKEYAVEPGLAAYIPGGTGHEVEKRAFLSSASCQKKGMPELFNYIEHADEPC